MWTNLLSKHGKLRGKLQEWYYRKHISKNISDNFITLNNGQTGLLKKSLVENTFPPATSFDSAEVQYQTDLLAVRFRNHRAQIIPWLNSIKPLKGLKILEIGCGNGTSTVALAEQGAVVTAVDIEEGLLKDAEARCRIYGVSANFHLLNATEVSTALAGEQFDMIVFFAVLEHMTYAERLTAIRQTYAMLAPGGLWSVIGTPNRLHCFDSHTAMLPFYYWLPDELAIQYATFSSRQEFASRFDRHREPSDEEKLEFARWGRGMSYHELELALGPLTELTIISDLMGFLRKRDPLYRALQANTDNGRYASMMRKMYPYINGSFFDPFLDLVIQK